MSTHASIAVQSEDGIVRSIYLHSDGYLSWAGKRLREFYNSQDLANQLINGGDISSLGKRIDPIGPHSFEEREEDTTVFYIRDRGEAVSACCADGYGDIRNWAANCGASHRYLFTNDQWHSVDYQGVLLSLSQLEIPE